jgi:hypothetical protein
MAVWSPRWNWPEFSKPAEPRRPKLTAVNSATTATAAIPATQRIRFGR